MLTNARAAEILDILADMRRRCPEFSSDPLVAEACARGADALREMAAVRGARRIDDVIPS